VPANLNVVPYPAAPSGVGDASIKQSVFPGCMANGLPASEANALAATQEPIATVALTQAHITKVDAPHLAMISNPGTVTNVILQAVRATS
jgi:hypothetical protein